MRWPPSGIHSNAECGKAAGLSKLAAPFLYIGLGFYLLYAAQLKPGGDGSCPALID